MGCLLVLCLTLTSKFSHPIAGSIVLSGTYSVISTAIDKLNAQGAIILGTTNLSEFANLRGELCPDGWSPLGGQCYGAYLENQNPSGSSSGSAVAARLGLAAGCLGTEACPPISLTTHITVVTGTALFVTLTKVGHLEQRLHHVSRRAGGLCGIQAHCRADLEERGYILQQVPGLSGAYYKDR